MSAATVGAIGLTFELHCWTDRVPDRAKWLADYDRAVARSLSPPAAPVRALLKAAAMRSNGAGLLSDAATERLVGLARLAGA